MTKPLSPRQGQIMLLVCRGYVAKEIAAEKHLSIFTVKQHIIRAKVRLGARNLAHAAALFVEKKSKIGV